MKKKIYSNQHKTNKTFILSNCSAQIWVETVVYTLIGLTIITILLAIILPQIEEKKDQIAIENSANILSAINSYVDDLIFYGAGNSQPIDELKIQRGTLTIDSKNDIINFEIKSQHEYSENNTIIQVGKIQALTSDKKTYYLVNLNLSYSGKINITWQGEDTVKTFQPSANPYKIMITNKGLTDPADIDSLINIDFTF